MTHRQGAHSAAAWSPVFPPDISNAYLAGYPQSMPSRYASSFAPATPRNGATSTFMARSDNSTGIKLSLVANRACIKSPINQWSIQRPVSTQSYFGVPLAESICSDEQICHGSSALSRVEETNGYVFTSSAGASESQTLHGSSAPRRVASDTPINGSGRAYEVSEQDLYRTVRGEVRVERVRSIFNVSSSWSLEYHALPRMSERASHTVFRSSMTLPVLDGIKNQMAICIDEVVG